ncbi:acyltransferase [Chromohalobacter canadensis]|uniref:acyltransferase family protein n=1 Tax=Chromohalobacter canadensis TaxID=141389 RepID=UPI0021C05961|nr:acyltransferase [Chromohalobacter canadensis]MCT8467743.1 acyltransferase [Chromohalobacter canadensis]MCT8470509.1 acyltransferase [Chromohalobacter canadensis]MCT8498240.1 acyltransferase [Chromohalobacter canadensis]
MDKTQQPGQKERFIGLEWLRFALGLYIVIFHTLHTYPSISAWSHYVTDIGFFSTSTFFVLSGFLLTHVYLDERRQLREPARSFWIKRFSNLYPIHIGSLVLAVSMSALIGYLAISPEDADMSWRFVIYDVNNDLGQVTPGALEHFMGNGEAALNLALNVGLLHAWNPYYLTFNPPSWSISALMAFYLVFPWIAPRLFRLRRVGRALALTNLLYLIPPLVVIAMTDFGMPETGILHRNPLIRLPEFVAGILLCVWYTRYRAAGGWLSVRRRLMLATFVATCVVVAVWLLGQGHAWYYLLHNGLLLPAQLALILLATQWRTPESRRVRRLASRLGGASLPMFALHVPLFVIFTRIERVLAGDPALCTSGFRACLDAAGDSSVVFYPLFLLLTVLFCVMFQEQFVLRVRNVMQRWLLPRVGTTPSHTEKVAR